MTEVLILTAPPIAFALCGTVIWHIIRKTRKLRIHAIRAAIIFVPLTAILFWKVPDIAGSLTFQFFGEPLHRVETKEKLVALTFDDHPSPPFTRELLEILDSCGVCATFFLIGKKIEQHPDLARETVARGHEVGNHSYSHARLTYKPMSHIQDQIEKTDQLIRELEYSGPIPFRAPFGQKLILLPLYLRQTGRINVSWDIALDTRKEFVVNPDLATTHLMNRVQPGSVILFHLAYNSNRPLMQALPEMIAKLRAQGYSFVTVSEMRERAREEES